MINKHPDIKISSTHSFKWSERSIDLVERNISLLCSGKRSWWIPHRWETHDHLTPGIQEMLRFLQETRLDDIWNDGSSSPSGYYFFLWLCSTLHEYLNEYSRMKTRGRWSGHGMEMWTADSLEVLTRVKSLLAISKELWTVEKRDSLLLLTFDWSFVVLRMYIILLALLSYDICFPRDELISKPIFHSKYFSKHGNFELNISKLGYD